MAAKGTILIIDDDPDALIYLSEILKDNDYETMVAPDGQTGLEKAREIRPDLILLDLMMPKTSGIWFLNKIKQDAALKDIPVVVQSGASAVTGVDMKGYLENQPFKERKKAALGVDVESKPDAYLDKPIKEQHLLETLERFIPKR